MTILTTVRPYHRLDKFDRLIIDERIKNFLRYAKRVRPQFVRSKVTVPKNATVSPLPASSATESEPEIDFLTKTDTEKRTRRPQKAAVGSETARIYDRTLKDRIAALIAERGPVTSADIGQSLDMPRQRTAATIIDVEAKEVAPAPRVPPSPETIAKGRAKIMRGCLKGGGNTILVFDELCAHGPLTRGDLQARLGCHRTMIDVALRTLDAFGLVVDLGKTMGSETGHMRRLWDVKSETEANE